MIVPLIANGRLARIVMVLSPHVHSSTFCNMCLPSGLAHPGARDVNSGLVISMLRDPALRSATVPRSWRSPCSGWHRPSAACLGGGVIFLRRRSIVDAGTGVPPDRLKRTRACASMAERGAKKASVHVCLSAPRPAYSVQREVEDAVPGPQFTIVELLARPISMRMDDICRTVGLQGLHGAPPPKRGPRRWASRLVGHSGWRRTCPHQS